MTDNATELAGQNAAKSYLHLISDATGETLSSLSRACLAQFEDVDVVVRHWSMIRTPVQMKTVIEALAEEPGLVLFSLVDSQLREILEEGCQRMRLSGVSVLDPVIGALARHFGSEPSAMPGRQHAMDSSYFARIEAMQYVLSHDDGQSTYNLYEADIILLGVSRTSKTPTSIYLANRGLKTANIPIVPQCPLPEELFSLTKPFIVGLTKDPKRLIQVRRNRLRMLNQDSESEYVDEDSVRQEVAEARRLYARHGWPCINVSRRSIEETAAEIYRLYQRRQQKSA